MDKLIEAIVNEVRLRDNVGHSEIPRALKANLELRIKGYLNVTLGIVSATDFINAPSNQLLVDQSTIR